MARNRMIKVDFHLDEKTGRLDSDTKLLFIGMWQHADDIGVGRANPILLKAQIFPYEERLTTHDIKKMYTNLSILRLIILGEFNGESYYFVKNFLKHQKVNRPSSFRYLEGSNKHNVLELFNSVSTHGTIIEQSLPKVKVNVKEKGKGSHEVSPSLVGNNYVSNAPTLVDEANRLATPTFIAKIWNGMATSVGLSKIRPPLSDERIRKINKALSVFPLEEDWLDIIEQVAADPFRIGQTDKKWKAYFNWLFKNENYIRMKEDYESQNSNMLPE